MAVWGGGVAAAWGGRGRGDAARGGEQGGARASSSWRHPHGGEAKAPSRAVGAG
jgi:hypothetical protein